jgi:exosortase
MTPRLAWWALFACAFAALFFPTFRWMAERFEAADSFYSHGWLIPVASGWLIWRQRTDLARVPRRATWHGLWLLVPCVAIHLVATWLRLGFVSGFAMLGALAGLVWTCWGWPILWRLRFPLAFLAFMVPLPGVLLIAISFQMKLMAASLATWLLQALGISAVQMGSTIRLPGLSVIVDDTCSGLRSLISLIALSTMWTALLGPSAPRLHKLVIVASAIPIALIANMIRIMTLVLLAAIYGHGIAEGFIHYGSGIVVFGIALAALAGISRCLQSTSLPSLGLRQSPS